MKLFAFALLLLAQGTYDTSSFLIRPASSRAGNIGGDRMLQAKSTSAEVGGFTGKKGDFTGPIVRSACVLALSTLNFGGPVLADELGVSKEAPTLYTGETIEICVKRGPLGACTKTAQRTLDNDNDKASKYQVTQSSKVAEKDASMRLGSDGIATSELIKVREDEACCELGGTA